MRIVHVLTRLLRAGSEENTLASCSAQIAGGHEVYLIHGNEYDESYYKNPIAGLKLVRVDSLVHPLNPGKDVAAFRAMKRLFSQLRPDIVHTHQSKAGVLGRFAAKAAGVRHIVHGVHIVPFMNVGTLQRLVYLAAERAAGAVTDAFIDVSPAMKAACVNAGVGTADRHHVIPSGFDLGRFRAGHAPEEWRDILGLAENEPRPPVILMMAALEPRKRHCEFLRAFPAVVARHPGVRLLMPGEGPHREAVESVIRELGLERNALLLGYRTDPQNLIALADFCMLTSTREGLPRVIMQYLAGGRPCIVSDLPGIEVVVRHGWNGIVTPADDMEAAAQAAIELIENEVVRQRLTQGARATDLDSWQVENMCRSIEEVYRNLLTRAER
ncbi:glycosyltransferase [Starkeya koreensis]|uniref:Glycosyltransferase n=1 Tax=Ancylobacter koreensis TaxID=266121 RepID=A0ABT0DGL9_9HYPH|nr:glycosyltransferase [Ancylobacter koreensis]MCK0206418.1 glycosyltransferase [Ancylobacter koreensis]